MSKIKTLNAKRLVAVFTAMLITILSLSYTNNNHADALNSNVKYYVYDAKTAEKIDEYFLSPLPYSLNTRNVVGNDDRVIDWTKSGVVKIMSPNKSIGSGFVVSDHVIATAAHCVYTNKISEILLFDNNGKQVMSATPVEYHIPSDYITSLKRLAYDYALISVKEDLSDYACFDLGVTLDSFPDTGSTISVTGFPNTITRNGKRITVNTSTEHMMYTGNGTVKRYNDDGSPPFHNISDLIYYDCDISEGNSGGPAYITESFKGKTYYTVIAINAHTKGDTNDGIRINTNLINFYKANQCIIWE
ncbi:MAG: serine protease [Ruminococcus sp.]|nr:serine protease [Ruminococcus sp.]